MVQQKKVGVIVLIACMLLSLSYPGLFSSAGTVHATVSFEDGDGSAAAPYQIATAEQFNEIRNYPTSHFVLIDDIDLSTDILTSEWQPITDFSGSLDGNHHRVTNLLIQGSANEIGLFKRLSAGAVINNVEIHALEVRNTGYFTGILAGVSDGGAGDVQVTGVSVTGTVYGTSNTGGLFGDAYFTEISGSHASGKVEGGDYTGGLIGYTNTSSVSSSSSSGSVVSTGSYIGGLIGHGENIALTGNVAEGDVTGQGDYVGGLAGRIENVTQIHAISNNSATGNVTGQSNYVGGLAGRVQNYTATDAGDLTYNHAAGAVTGVDNIGGLFGSVQNSNTTSSYASGDVQGNNSVGGLVGEYAEGTITDSYAIGSVTAYRNEGGLVGSLQNGAVTSSYATGEVHGRKNTGGLVGELNNSSVIYSYAIGTIVGNEDAGGLVGGNRSGQVSFSFAAGNVFGCDDIGGLAGDMDDALIANSYATGDVTGTCAPGSNSLGGLVGDNRSSTIENSFAIGAVTGNYNIGGLVGDNGYNAGILTNSYYDMDLTGQSDDRGIGLTTEQMKDIENYAGWDFYTIWNTDQHHYGYPYLAGMQQVFLTYMGNDANNDHDGLYASKFYRVGTLVTIENLNWTRSGYTFQGWNSTPDGSGVTYTIGDTIPLNSSLILYATWKRVGSGSSYWQSDDANLADLSVAIDGEQLMLLPEFAAEETSYRAETTSSEVTIKASASDARATVTLNDERLDREVTVDLVEGDNVFEIVVKAESGRIKTYSLTIHLAAEREDDPTQPQTQETPVCTFTDVTGHWAASFICEAFERGIVSGYTQTIFSPQSEITRAEFVTMLLRTLGMTSSDSSWIEINFVDLDQIPAWATSAFHYAVENGIIQGYPDRSLRPLDNVSRAEMVAIIGRAMQWEMLQENTAFDDDADIPLWAQGYVQEAVKRGLLYGRGDNRFSPNEPATRAEVTVMLLRLWLTLGE